MTGGLSCLREQMQNVAMCGLEYETLPLTEGCLPYLRGQPSNVAVLGPEIEVPTSSPTNIGMCRA